MCFLFLIIYFLLLTKFLVACFVSCNSQVQGFLERAIEHISSKKRNLQVVHQLLRVREVNLQTQTTHVTNDSR